MELIRQVHGRLLDYLKMWVGLGDALEVSVVAVSSVLHHFEVVKFPIVVRLHVSHTVIHHVFLVVIRGSISVVLRGFLVFDGVRLVGIAKVLLLVVILLLCA